MKAEVITEEEKGKIEREVISSRAILDNCIVLMLKPTLLGYYDRKEERERVYDIPNMINNINMIDDRPDPSFIISAQLPLSLLTDRRATIP